MAQGIVILGLNGCGKTTVGRMAAQRLGFLHMDAEDYYFPIPGSFSISRSEAEVQQLMEADAQRCTGFVISCVRCSMSGNLLEQIRLAIVLRAPADVRAIRIRQRDADRFGPRVLPGGDLYESQQAFRAFAAERTEETVDQTLHRLSCPVVEMDAALAPETIADMICQAFKDIKDIKDIKKPIL